MFVNALKIYPYALIFSLLISCVSSKKYIANGIDKELDSGFYSNQFNGLLVVDPETKDTLYDLNSDKYFTPASNTKIFTLFTALKTLPNNIPALSYNLKNDTLFFEGTGDPSFLHPYLKDSTAYLFLKNYKNLAFYPNNFMDAKLGPGWSWDDYQWYYSPERNAFPIHGNVVTISTVPDHLISPGYFKDSVLFVENDYNRDLTKNRFYFEAKRTDTLVAPFITNTNTTHNLLQNILAKEIKLIDTMPVGPKTTLKGIHADSLYVRLMHESDNFIAEQLLLLSALQMTDTLNTVNAIDYILKNELADLPQQPRWVDGSGLSRYNLFTPKSMVYVLNKLYKEIPTERLFKIFPTGGVNGTLKNWYGNVDKPFIYAKSGSLGNNYCLSGYLQTNSGKVLIFSFMNNHFRKPSSELKQRMQLIFETIRDNY